MGRARILIDTGEGMPIWIESLMRVLEEEKATIASVLLTHWHGDHTGGVPHLLERFPHLQKAIYKHEPDKGQQALSDGQIFSVEGARVCALLTPGHSTDHMCFILEEESALFTGDNILGHGFTVVEDLGVFMASLEKMRARNCVKGYPAHGAIIENLPTKILLCLGRHHRRERQVMGALRQEKLRTGRGSLTIKELVRTVYGLVSDEISASALEPSLNETLQKLAEDGTVGFELDRVPQSLMPCRRWFVVTH